MVFWLENYIINPYLRTLIILVIVFGILKLFIFILEKFIYKFTSRTKTKVDDIFISKSSKPITSLILLIGLLISINELPINEVVLNIFRKIISSLIIISFSFLIYYLIDIVLFAALSRTVKTNSSARQSLMNLMKSILRVVIIAVVVLYVLHNWGIEIGPFLAAMGIAGLAVALALQPALGNIFSGISIILDKSVKVGDVIYLDAETKGKVFHIGLRSTKILTFDNELIIVPNNKIADSKIQNIAEPDPKARVVIPFGVAYGSNIEKVKKIVLVEVKKVNHFISQPEPLVRFLEMANSSLNFKAYFYVDSYENRFAAIDEANTKIYNALNKNKISIPFPQMDIHLKRK